MWATGTVIVLLFSLLAGCASAPSGNAPRQGPQEVSRTFQACFAESKLPWLVSVVAADKSNTKPLEKLVADFVGGSAADQQRARSYLNDLRLKKYASGEEMAGAHFQACMARGSAEKFEPSRSISCYKEQRLIFALEVLRFDNNVGMAEATQHLIKANPSADGSTESVIRRLAKDTYTILTPGGESAFSEAQFRLCMTSNP
jgi:hypothetical protein